MPYFRSGSPILLVRISVLLAQKPRTSGLEPGISAVDLRTSGLELPTLVLEVPYFRLGSPWLQSGVPISAPASARVESVCPGRSSPVIPSISFAYTTVEWARGQGGYSTGA